MGQRKTKDFVPGLILLALAVLLAVLFVHGLLDYGRVSQYSLAVKVVLFLVVPVLSLTLAGATLRSAPAFKAKLSLLLCSSLGSLYLAESILVVAPSLLGGVSAAEDAFDTRSKLQVVHDLRKGGHRAYPSVFPSALMQRQDDGTLRSRREAGNSCHWVESPW